MIGEYRDPGYEDTAGYKIDEPPEDSQGSFTETE